jgi:hypothetical protein
MTNRTDEGFADILSKISKALDPVARAHKKGMKEIAGYTKQAMGHFMQYMGRNRQEWKNVTWNTLYKFLTIPNILGLDSSEINKIVLDPDTKSKINSAFPGISADYWTNYYGKPKQLLAGDPASANVNLAQAVGTAILELAVITWLDKASQTKGIDDPTSPPPPPPSPPSPPPPPSPPSPPSPPPPIKPTRPSPTGDAVLDALNTAKYRAEYALYIMRGGTP